MNIIKWLFSKDYREEVARALILRNFRSVDDKAISEEVHGEEYSDKFVIGSITNQIDKMNQEEAKKNEECIALKAEIDSLMDKYIEQRLTYQENLKKYKIQYDEILNDDNIPYGEVPYYVDGVCYIMKKTPEYHSKARNENESDVHIKAEIKINAMFDLYGDIPEKSNNKHLERVKDLIRLYNYTYSRNVDNPKILRKYFMYFDLKGIKYNENTSSSYIEQKKNIIYRGYVFSLEHTYWVRTKKSTGYITMISNKMNNLTEDENNEEV